MTQEHAEKENPSSPIRSRTYDLPITSSDALPLSYRRLLGPWAIKLGTWGKHQQGRPEVDAAQKKRKTKS